MKLIEAQLEKLIELNNDVHILKVYSPIISSQVLPGQFLNIRINKFTTPLLRRPFSVCDVEGDYFYLMFNTLGLGTSILATKQIGESLDIIGPLGRGFNINSDYESAILVGGGLGVAPFPFLTRSIKETRKISTYIGGRNKKDIITYGLQNIKSATDDGTLGFKGTVVDLLRNDLNDLNDLFNPKCKIFACGPTPMLKALVELTNEMNIECEISTECAMACGFGICQGCPIQSAEDKDKYFLVCKDGPIFNSKEVIL